MKQSVKANYERISELHEKHLQSPVSEEKKRKAIELYRRAVESRRDLEAHTEKLVREQKRLAAKKRAMREKHAAIRERMKREEAALHEAAAKTHQALRAAGRGAEDARRIVNEMAETLILTHGSGPLELDGVVYDFGCYGLRVYLVPRVKARKRR